MKKGMKGVAESREVAKWSSVYLGNRATML